MRATVIVGVSATVAALIVIAGWSAPAFGSADEATPLTVVLMGDSYTAGNGARSAGGDPAYYGTEKCLQSTATWGEQYADALADQGFAVTLLNRACSAASTDALLHDRLLAGTVQLAYPDVEPAATPRDDAMYDAWARADARCTPTPASAEYVVTDVVRTPAADGGNTVAVTCERWLRPQVEALNPDVDLVLLTVGGNDVHFPDIVRTCLIVADADECERALDVADAYVTNDFAADLIDVFTELENRTAGNARIVYLAYPNLEVNSDLELTGISRDGVKRIPVAARLNALSHAGLTAQRAAVDAVNARFQDDPVILLDGIPDLFAGHEPDARPAVRNEDRWMYEAFETPNRDEWYHLTPEGHRQIATYVASFGDFGAARAPERAVPARDVAVIVGDRGMADAAVRGALADQSLWAGAAITLIEQRIAPDGVSIERRILATGVGAREAARALETGARPTWQPAADVVVPTRWNASAHVVYVGDPSLSLGDIAPVWSAEHEGREAHVDLRTVDVAPLRIGAGSAAASRIDTALTDVEDRLKAALADVQATPHAWAGGPYIATGSRASLSAHGSYPASGASDRGVTHAANLTYEWDLDADGHFETRASGPVFDVAAGQLTPGWIAVRVTTPAGHSSVASAWVASVPVGADGRASCVADGAGVRVTPGPGRTNCGTETYVGSGPDGEELPAHDNSLRLASGDGHLQLGVAPLYADERVTSSERGRHRVGARDGKGRERIRIYMKRERALRALREDCAAQERVMSTPPARAFRRG